MLILQILMSVQPTMAVVNNSVRIMLEVMHAHVAVGSR
jgi:hypothetical protein